MSSDRNSNNRDNQASSISGNSMVSIVTKDQAIPIAIADAAYKSLDKEIDRRREEGALKAGKKSSVKLEWTRETQEVVRIFEAAIEAV